MAATRAAACARKEKKRGTRIRKGTRKLETIIAFHNVRTIVLHGKNGPERAVEVLKSYKKLGRDVGGLHRRPSGAGERGSGDKGIRRTAVERAAVKGKREPRGKFR